LAIPAKATTERTLRPIEAPRYCLTSGRLLAGTPPNNGFVTKKFRYCPGYRAAESWEGARFIVRFPSMSHGSGGRVLA